MECSNSDALIMKYMDNTITEKEAGMLHDHLSACEECMMDFKIYDEIMAGFAKIEMIPVPDGFEDCVMAKVKECGVEYGKRTNTVDNMITFITGAVSIVFGLLFMLVVNRDRIMNYLFESEIFGSYARAVSPMINVVNDYVNGFTATALSFAGMAGGFVSDYKYLILAGFIGVLITQYILRKRDKVEL